MRNSVPEPMLVPKMYVAGQAEDEGEGDKEPLAVPDDVALPLAEGLALTLVVMVSESVGEGEALGVAVGAVRARYMQTRGETTLLQMLSLMRPAAIVSVHGSPPGKGELLGSPEFQMETLAWLARNHEGEHSLDSSQPPYEVLRVDVSRVPGQQSYTPTHTTAPTPCTSASVALSMMEGRSQPGPSPRHAVCPCGQVYEPFSVCSDAVWPSQG